MRCKLCGCYYADSDGLQYGTDRYGWCPTFGHCFLCFCFHLFGGMLEPSQERWQEIYEITP